MVKIKGSKTGDIINAKFQGQAKSFFPSLKQTKIVVLLSIIGNEFCSKKYLESIIKTSTSNFGFTTFLIADEVYWNNLCNNFSKEEEIQTKKIARNLGIDYFNKNLEAFISQLKLEDNIYNKLSTLEIDEKLNIINDAAKQQANFEIVFWSDWLKKCPEYEYKHKIISSCFNSDASLKKSIEKTALNFANRHQDENNSKDLLFQRSSAYLIEESPAVIWIAASLGYNFIAYPGEIIKPFKTAQDFFIKDSEQIDRNDYCIYTEEPKLLANWLEITFHRSHNKKLSLSNKLHENNELMSSNHIISELMNGITKGIFSLEIDNKTKTKLLVDIIFEYQNRHENVEHNLFNNLLEKLQIN